MNGRRRKPDPYTLWDRLAVTALIAGVFGLLIFAIIGASAVILWMGTVIK